MSFEWRRADAIAKAAILVRHELRQLELSGAQLTPAQHALMTSVPWSDAAESLPTATLGTLLDAVGRTCRGRAFTDTRADGLADLLAFGYIEDLQSRHCAAYVATVVGAKAAGSPAEWVEAVAKFHHERRR